MASNKCLESTLQRTKKQLRKAKLKMKHSKLPQDRNGAEKRIQELEGKKLRLEQELIFNKAVSNWHRFLFKLTYTRNEH